jgi:hypothetical protein
MTIKNGFARVVDISTSELAINSGSQKRLSIGYTALSVEGADTAALLAGMGTATTPSATATADENFLAFYSKTTATSGTCRGIYNRLYMAGAGGDGESLRSYSDVSAALANAHGAHISLGFGESTTVGSISGLGVAVRATLGIPNGTMPANGTYAAVEPEIYTFGSNSAVSAVTELSFIRCSNAGDSTGIGRVGDKAFLIVLDGDTIAGGNIVEASTTEAKYAYSIRVKMCGTTMYLMCADAVG